MQGQEGGVTLTMTVTITRSREIKAPLNSRVKACKHTQSEGLQGDPPTRLTLT